MAEPIPVEVSGRRAVAPAGPLPVFDDRANHREFVEVVGRDDEPHRLRRGSRPTTAARPVEDTAPAGPDLPPVTPPPQAETRWDLWGDLDR